MRVTNCPCLPGPVDVFRIRTSSFKVSKVLEKTGPVGHPNGDMPGFEILVNMPLQLVLI